jgi:hypothetical protein
MHLLLKCLQLRFQIIYALTKKFIRGFGMAAER